MFIIERHPKILKRNAVSARKLRANNQGRWLDGKCDLQKLCSLFKDICVDYGRKLLREKNSKMRQRIHKNSFIATWVHWVKILCTYIFYSHVEIPSLLWIKFNGFHLPTLLLEFTGYFQRAASLPYIAASIPDKNGVSTGIRERRRRDNFFFMVLYLESLHFCIHFAYSLVE